MSIASEQAAEARRRAATTIGYYNLKLGPTAWNFGTGLEVDYNSNVNLTESNPEGDFIFRPQINTRMLWPVSEMNSINLALGGGYSAYVKNPRLDQAFITPGSELSFDLYAGDFWINLHDRFSITENNYQDPSVANSGNYSQFQNALGVATVWDLNKAIVRAGYDHVNYDIAKRRQQPELRRSAQRVFRGLFQLGGLRAETGHASGRGAGRSADHLHDDHHEYAL